MKLEKPILLWLDDYRNPFDTEIDWMVFSPIGKNVSIKWVKNYDEFIKYISNNEMPDGICFDHDLGFISQTSYRKAGKSKRESRRLSKEEKTGYDCAKWLVDYCINKNIDIPPYSIQSANPTGKENIQILLNNYKNFYIEKNLK